MLDGSPLVYVRVLPLEARGGLAYSADLMLFQRVALVRAPQDRRTAATWQVGSVEFSSPAAAYQVRGSLSKLADAFARDFRAANAPEPAPE
jgi:hypothetical protein